MTSSNASAGNKKSIFSNNLEKQKAYKKQNRKNVSGITFK